MFKRKNEKQSNVMCQSSRCCESPSRVARPSLENTFYLFTGQHSSGDKYGVASDLCSEDRQKSERHCKASSPEYIPYFHHCTENSANLASTVLVAKMTRGSKPKQI